jgi:hypothetical protein
VGGPRIARRSREEQIQALFGGNDQKPLDHCFAILTVSLSYKHLSIHHDPHLVFCLVAFRMLVDAGRECFDGKGY